MKTKTQPDLGVIPIHWDITEIGDVADVTKLAGYEFTKHIEYIEDGEIVALRSLNVVDGQLELSNIKRIAKSVSDKLPRSKLFKNDLLLTYTGSKLGDTALIDANDKYHLAPNVCRLRANEDDDAYFLYLFLRSKTFANILDNFKVGSGQPTVPMKNIRKIPLPWPPKVERTAIERIYRGLNDKIELNRQINQTLEQIAQAIFKSWFVDFEPVKAKIEAKQKGRDPKRAAMCAISGKTDEELDHLPADQLEQIAAIAALFPDKLVNSDLGVIPSGWKMKTIDDVTSRIIDHRGKTPKKLGGDWSESGFAAISAKNIKNGRIVNHSSIRYVDEILYQRWMNVELETGDILLTSEAPMGEMYFLSEKTKYCLSQRLYGLRANKESATAAYLYLWLQTSQAKIDMESRATGTTVVGVRQSELRKIEVLSPNIKLLDKFEDLVMPIYQHIHLNENQISKLNQLQETLLPKLLNGEINFNSCEGA